MDLFDRPGEGRTALRLLRELGELSLDDTTPIQALQLLHRWRSECDGSGSGGSDPEGDSGTDSAAAERPRRPRLTRGPRPGGPAAACK